MVFTWLLGLSSGCGPKKGTLVLSTSSWEKPREWFKSGYGCPWRWEGCLKGYHFWRWWSVCRGGGREGSDFWGRWVAGGAWVCLFFTWGSHGNQFTGGPSFNILVCCFALCLSRGVHRKQRNHVKKNIYVTSTWPTHVRNGRPSFLFEFCLFDLLLVCPETMVSKCENTCANYNNNGALG